MIGGRHDVIAPALVVLALLGAWEAYVRLGGISALLLPAPDAVAAALWDDRALLAPDLWVTVREVLLGLLVAVALGVAVAIAMHLWHTARRALLPLAIGSQAIPMPVIAGPLVFILGFGLAPKIVIVVLVCFFPVTVTLHDGLRHADPQACRLLAAFGASRWQILRLVEARAALPGAFSGLKVAAAIAVIGAVFAEWAGSSAGLGHMVLSAGASLDTARSFAATTLLFALSIALYGLFALLERRVVDWERHT